MTPIIFNSFQYDTKKNTVEYVPYTSTSMIDTTDIKFYENFWNSVIKEDCDSNSMVE